MSKSLPLMGFALCLGAALAFCPGQRCQAEWGEPSAAEQRIADELKNPTEIQFIDTPLQDFFDTLEDYHQIEIQFDRRALDEVGIPRDTPITKSLKGISLRSALRLLLRDLDLTYVIRHDTLLITTTDEAETLKYVRVYSVNDLVGERGAGGSASQGCESLVQAIKESVVPESWEHVGGPGAISTLPPGRPTSLVVDQHQRVHEEIADFLAVLREAVRMQADGRFQPVSGSALTATAERAIAKALKEPSQFEFIDTPLQDAVDTLEDVHEIQIKIDQRALDEVGIPSDSPITKSLRGLSLASALELMLRDLDLAYVVRDEVLLITTPEEAKSMLLTKLYPLNGLQAGRAEAARFEQSYVDAVIATITKLIRPESWKDVGGPGSVSVLSLRTLEALVIRQTRDVHEEIEGLLGRPEFRRSAPSNRGTAPKRSLRRQRR
jgi:hypothetical protein